MTRATLFFLIALTVSSMGETPPPPAVVPPPNATNPIATNPVAAKSLTPPSVTPNPNAQASLIVLEGSSTIVFADAGGTRKAVAAVKPTTARPKLGEEPSVIEFSLGDLRNPAPGEPLKIKWKRAKDPANAPEGIEFELDDAVRRPGVYTVHIAPLPASNPTERLRIQIDIKPAKLVLPQKLIVARTINWPLQTNVLQPKLEVREGDRATRVPMLAVSRTSAFSGTLPIAAGLTPDPGPVAIPAGQSAEVKYTVDKGVPLGTVTGSLRFSAAELAEPVTLDYEVRTKLTSAFIPLIIALGFLLGWLVRKRLVDIAQLGEARERAKTLLAKVDKSLADLPDEKFRTAIKPLRDELEKARKGTTTLTIADAITALDAAWRAALVEFDRRKVAATEKVAELKYLAGPPLPLPPATDQWLATARNAAAWAADAITRNDVTEAERLLMSEESLATEILKIALEWQEQIVKIVGILQRAPNGLPAPVQTQFVEQAGKVSFDRIKPEAGFNTPELRRALFIEFHTETRDVCALLGELSTRLEFEWNLIAKAIDSVRRKFQSQYDVLWKAIASFRRDLEQVSNDPAPFAATLVQRLEDLGTSWRATLVTTAPADKKAELEKFADDRQYLQLAKALATALGSPQRSAAPGAPDLGVVPWLTMSMQPRLPAAFDRPARRPIETPEPIEALTPGQARFLQSALLALLYIAVYWLLNPDGFGSSMTDVAMLFITSFGLDLSVEGLLRLKK